MYNTGRWYLVGRDHLRADLRTIRLDRVRNVEVTGERFPPCDDIDPVAHLVKTLAEVPYGIDPRVLNEGDEDMLASLTAWSVEQRYPADLPEPTDNEVVAVLAFGTRAMGRSIGACTSQAPDGRSPPTAGGNVDGLLAVKDAEGPWRIAD